MQDIQNIPNPDVNSTEFDDDFGSHEGVHGGRTDGGSDTERGGGDEDVVPVPPDKQPVVPVEDPRESDEAPVGDVDDSPKRIVGD